MSTKLVLLIKAVVSIVIAIFMLFFATTFLGWFLKSSFLAAVPAALAGGLGQASQQLLGGVTQLHEGLAGVVKLMCAFFGATLLGIGLICYFASNATASVLRKKVVLSLAIADTLGFIFALIAQLKGLFSGLGWIIVILWLVLAALLAFVFVTDKTA
jgi:hypothetical protein